MLYAIIDETTHQFKGYYDDSYGNLTPDANFIEVTQGELDALTANPKQQWSGTEWEAIPPALAELKASKLHTLNAVILPDREWVDWTKGSESGGGWMPRNECMELRYTLQYSGGSTFYVLGVATDAAKADTALEAMEVYNYALDNWLRAKRAAIEAAADETALDAIDLYDYPVHPDLSL